jgi:RimJ/RimL family protein N-acetyltransferase
MCADPEVMRHFPYVLTREESEAQVGSFVGHWEERGFGLWAVEEKAPGAFIGFVGLQYNEERSEGEHKTEVGWRLDRACWNRGFATEGARASLGYGLEVLELERIVSFTAPENAASRRVMEKCGLVQRGETRWRGLEHVWYAIDRREWEAAQNRLLKTDRLNQACSSA